MLPEFSGHYVVALFAKVFSERSCETWIQYLRQSVDFQKYILNRLQYNRCQLESILHILAETAKTPG